LLEDLKVFMTSTSGVLMLFAEYQETPGLSVSGMKHLAVSPLRYWFLRINPDRPEEEETPYLRFGSALHCAVLEPGEFDNRYARKLQKDEIEGLLVTVEDLREYCSSKGIISKARRKDEIIEAVLRHDPTAPVWDVMEMQYAEANAGKILLSADEWERVAGASEAVRCEPKLQPILADGIPEACLFAKDPATGVSLKGRADWLAPGITVDLKTFTQQRGKSIDKAVNDAIFYEKYHWQAWVYTHLLQLSSGNKQRRYLNVFVESEKPHEIRLRELRPSWGEPNFYWERAGFECRELMEAYSHYSKKFGTRPWREEAELVHLIDEHMPQIAY